MFRWVSSNLKAGDRSASRSALSGCDKQAGDAARLLPLRAPRHESPQACQTHRHRIGTNSPDAFEAVEEVQVAPARGRRNSFTNVEFRDGCIRQTAGRISCTSSIRVPLKPVAEQADGQLADGARQGRNLPSANSTGRLTLVQTSAVLGVDLSTSAPPGAARRAKGRADPGCRPCSRLPSSISEVHPLSRRRSAARASRPSRPASGQSGAGPARAVRRC